MKLFNFNRVIRSSCVVFLITAAFTLICSISFSEEPMVTPSFIYLYGYGPLSVGDVVTVSTEEGVLCGKTIVTVDGQYGQMAVYGDDTTTKDKKDGAGSGERLVIKINGEPIDFPSGREPVFGVDGETYQVDLD